MARLEILNEALDPLFAQVPEKVDLFDRGVSQGETPRLWIDVVAHILMGRDKRIYRFVQDTRFGRIVLAESHDVPVIVDAVTDYVARRMIEREHAMVATPMVEPVVEESRAAAASGCSCSASCSAPPRCSASRCLRACGISEVSGAGGSSVSIASSIGIAAILLVVAACGRRLVCTANG